MAQIQWQMLILGKQKAEIQRPALAIATFLISAFYFPDFCFSLVGM